MKAKIDLEKFICSYVKYNNIQDALKDQGLKCWRGEIVEIPQESEDEKMKNWILDELRLSYQRAAGDSDRCEELLKAITWLEKQGQQKYIPKYKIGDYVKNTNYKGEPIYEIIYMDKECYICEYRGKEKMGDKTVMHFSFDNPYLRLVQKPVDKAEPKFHEGEWITHNTANFVFKIINVSSIGYDVFNRENYKKTISFDNEDNYHLWNIAKDAKPGDVLCYKDEISLYKHDIKDWKETSFGGFVYYCCYDGKRFITDSFYSLTEQDKTDIHPATKEQRDLLFKKMKEAGYEWDEKTHELRKIEQKLANSAKTCKNDTLLDLLNKMPSCITADGIDYHFVMAKHSYYIAYYKAIGEEGRGNAIFGITAHSPIDLLAEMLEILKEKGLLE